MLVPAEMTVTELDLLVIEGLQDALRAEERAWTAALPWRAAAVADLLNRTMAGLLPDGLRFEWGPAGE
jgi:hypothetical protein